MQKATETVLYLVSLFVERSKWDYRVEIIE
jgi:hypothetical protein